MEPQEIIQNAIRLFGEKNQLIVAIEELSELQKSLCKRLRGDEENLEQIAEEVADVQIMLEQIVPLLRIGADVEVFREYKLHRLQNRIEKEWGRIWSNDVEV